LIAVDLDGTLLREDKTISNYTLNVLSRCREAGIKVVCATGRGGSIQKLTPTGLFDGIVRANGALAEADGVNTHSKLVPYEIARPFLVACDKHGLRMSSQIGDKDYSNFRLTDVWDFFNEDDFEIVDFATHDKDAEKIFSDYATQDEVDIMTRLLPKELSLVAARDGIVMIMHKDANKASGLAALATHWGIAQEEIAAFGDDFNDIDMLRYAGVGIAMGNALDEVKVIADFVCGTNEDDGIAKWILGNIPMPRNGMCI